MSYGFDRLDEEERASAPQNRRSRQSTNQPQQDFKDFDDDYFDELADPTIGRFAEGAPDKEEVFEQSIAEGERLKRLQYDPPAFIATAEHTVYKTPRGSRYIDGYDLDQVDTDFNIERQLTILFGSVEEAERIFEAVYNAPRDPNTGERIIPEEFGGVTKLEKNASIETRQQFSAQMRSKTTDGYRTSARNRTPVGKAPRFTRPPNTSGNPSDNGTPPPPAAKYDDLKPDEKLQPQSPASLALNDSTYGSIVSGWNEKLAANNVKLSSLVPFAELYVVFDSNDILFSQGSDKFTGIKNRVGDIKFVGNKDNFTSNGGQVPPPILPKGISPNAKVAKIGESKSQTNPDYVTQYTDTGLPVAAEQTFRGSPGITDVSVSRASGGAFNIKYDINITLPNPEIVNEQYEYSKLLLLNSTFLLIHGWNVTDSSFSSDNYPPKIIGSPTPVEIALNSSNNGYWSASLISLYDFSFEFDNVGHLVGRCRFLTSQGAFMSSVSTDQVANPILDKLKEVPPELLQRTVGDKIKEKQTFIFSNGVPWSRSDISKNDEVLNEASIEEGLTQAYQQLNDTNLTSDVSLSQSFFDGVEVPSEGRENNIYSFERYQTVSEKIKLAVEDAANAMRVFFRFYGKKKYAATGPNRNQTPGAYGIQLDRRGDGNVRGLAVFNRSSFNFLPNDANDSTVESFIFPNTIDSRFMTVNRGKPENSPRAPTVDREGTDRGEYIFTITFTNKESQRAKERSIREQLNSDPFIDRDGEQDLRNYYYNNILMNIADTDNDLAFIPPQGFKVEEESKILVPILGVGEEPKDADTLETNFRTMGKGQLIDEQLKNLVPAGTFQQPNVETMPNFGQTLQSEIFSEFDKPDNLNNFNLSRTNVDADGVHRVLDKEVSESIRSSTTLSVPTLVTAPENPVAPNIGLTPEEARAKGQLLMEILLIRKVLTDDEGDETTQTVVYQIKFPQGPTTEVNNVYNLIQENEEFEQIEVLETEATITLFQPEEGESIQINKDERVGTDDYFCVRKTFVMNNGYAILRQRETAQQEYIDQPPRALREPQNEDDGFFIPDVTQILSDENVPQNIRELLTTVIDTTKDVIGLSAPLLRRDFGSAANVTVNVRNVDYNVIMRPTYFYLGSVLEALSRSLAGRVKFFYRALPLRASDKAVTIPIPANAQSELIEGLKKEIFNNNVNICKLGGQPVGEGVSRSDFIGNLQTTEQEEQNADVFVEQVLKWHIDFSQYMEDVIEQGDFSFIGSGDEGDQHYFGLTNELRVTIGSVKNELIPGSRNSSSDFYANDSDLLITDEDGNTRGRPVFGDDSLNTRYEAKIRRNFNISFDIGKNNVGRYVADNGVGDEQYSFFISRSITTAVGAKVPPGIYSINGGADIVNVDDPILFAQLQGAGFKGTGTQRTKLIEDKELKKAKVGGGTNDIVLDFMERNGLARDLGNQFPNINAILPVSTAVDPEDATKVERLQTQTAALIEQKNGLGFENTFNDLQVRTTFEIPVEISDVEQILTQEGAAPTHSLLKKLLSAASAAMPQLRLSMRTHSTDPSYIDVFVNAINEDGVIQEVFNEIDASDLTGDASESVDQFRRSVVRSGTYLSSSKVIVCNFGTMDSLVENFQMSSKVDPNAFAAHRLPTIMGGVSMDISNILQGFNLQKTGLLDDIKRILEDGPVGGATDLKELQIVKEVESQTSDEKRLVVDKVGEGRIIDLLTNNTSPIMRKTAQSFVEDLMSQDVTLYNKIRALQSEYFSGIPEAASSAGALGENERFAGSRFFGNILNTYLRTVTLTIHGTTNLNVFNYIYLKGILSGVEGLYIINSVNESVTPTSFTTTLECKLVEYTQNDQNKNPLAYRGEASLRRFAEISRGFRLPTENTDATIDNITFEQIRIKAEQDDGFGSNQ